MRIATKRGTCIGGERSKEAVAERVYGLLREWVAPKESRLASRAIIEVFRFTDLKKILFAGNQKKNRTVNMAKDIARFFLHKFDCLTRTVQVLYILLRMISTLFKSCCA